MPARARAVIVVALFIAVAVSMSACTPGRVVGLRTFTIENEGSTYTWADGSVTVRPVRVFMWYPARSGSPPALTMAGYVERTFAAPTAPRFPEGDGAVEQALASWLESGLGSSLSIEQVRDLLAQPVRAVVDAEEEGGRWPLVVLAGSLGSPAFLHQRLAESLALDGFIVVAVAGLGPAEGRRPSLGDGGVELLASDLNLALERALAIPGVGAERIGAVAWSMGGLAITAMELRRARFDVVVSLDSGLGYDYGVAATAAIPAEARARLTVPFVHIAAQPPERVPQDFSYFTLAAPREGWWRREDRLTHAQFTSLGILGAEATRPDAGAIASVHDTVIDDATLAFGAYLRGDAASRAALGQRFERRR